MMDDAALESELGVFLVFSFLLLLLLYTNYVMDEPPSVSRDSPHLAKFVFEGVQVCLAIRRFWDIKRLMNFYLLYIPFPSISYGNGIDRKDFRQSVKRMGCPFVMKRFMRDDCMYENLGVFVCNVWGEE